jgi:hypothetical protein
LGDRLFWSGLVPALASAALALVLLGAGPWPVLGFLVVHNAVRVGLAPWLLRLGWDHGLQVGAALGRSALPRVSVLAEESAAFAGALALPLVVRRFLGGAGGCDHWGPGLVVAALLVRRKAARGLRSADPGGGAGFSSGTGGSGDRTFSDRDQLAGPACPPPSWFGWRAPSRATSSWSRTK